MISTIWYLFKRFNLIHKRKSYLIDNNLAKYTEFQIKLKNRLKLELKELQIKYFAIFILEQLAFLISMVIIFNIFF